MICKWEPHPPFFAAPAGTDERVRRWNAENFLAKCDGCEDAKSGRLGSEKAVAENTGWIIETDSVLCPVCRIKKGR